jgi:hypothetical protein
MIWGCMPAQGVKDMCVLYRRMDAELHTSIHITEQSISGEIHHIENTIYLTTCFTIRCSDSSMVKFT